MKKQYEVPIMDLVDLEPNNVVVTSGGPLSPETWTSSGEGTTGFDTWYK